MLNISTVLKYSNIKKIIFQNLKIYFSKYENYSSSRLPFKTWVLEQTYYIAVHMVKPEKGTKYLFNHNNFHLLKGIIVTP